MPTSVDQRWMQQAIDLAVENVREGRGGPFAALLVHGDALVAEGTNRVTTSHDPTAHAEIVAIRAACKALDDFQLTGCTLYTTCEPCPMCLGAIYWARLERVVYACTQVDAANAGFDDAHIYKELALPPEDRRIPMHQALRREGQRVFDAWNDFDARVEY